MQGIASVSGGGDIEDPEYFWTSMYFALFYGNFAYSNETVSRKYDFQDEPVEVSVRLYKSDVVKQVGRVMLDGSSDLPVLMCKKRIISGNLPRQLSVF